MLAMPPLVIQVLVPLSTHSSVGLVVDGPGAQRADVGAGVGLGHAEGRQLAALGGAEALRQPLADLLGRAVGEDARHAERGAEDGQGDAGVAPAISSFTTGRRRPVGSPKALADEVERVQPDLGRLLR